MSGELEGLAAAERARRVAAARREALAAEAAGEPARAAELARSLLAIDEHDSEARALLSRCQAASTSANAPRGPTPRRSGSGVWLAVAALATALAAWAAWRWGRPSAPVFSGASSQSTLRSAPAGAPLEAGAPAAAATQPAASPVPPSLPAARPGPTPAPVPAATPPVATPRPTAGAGSAPAAQGQVAERQAAEAAADDLRRALSEARQAGVAADSELFQQASATAEQAQRALERREYNGSRAAFERAALQLRTAAEELGRLRELQRELAAARAAFQTAKARQPASREALEAEQRALALTAEARLAEAAAAYRQATALVERVAGALEGDRGAVLAAVTRYERALEARDLGALRAVWPGLKGREEAQARDAFRLAQSLEVTLEIREVLVEGERAEVSGVRFDELRTTDGQRLRNRREVRFTLRRLPAGWVIETLR